MRTDRPRGRLPRGSHVRIGRVDGEGNGPAPLLTSGWTDGSPYASTIGCDASESEHDMWYAQFAFAVAMRCDRAWSTSMQEWYAQQPHGRT